MDAPKKAYERSITGVDKATRELLARGAGYWSSHGPAHLSEELVALMQFDSVRAAGEHLACVQRQLTEDEPVSVLDLTRALWLTELGVVSVVVGPSDWENVYATSGAFDDFIDNEVVLLRAAQDELAEKGVPASGTDPFGKNPRSLRTLTRRLTNPSPHDR